MGLYLRRFQNQKEYLAECVSNWSLNKYILYISGFDEWEERKCYLFVKKAVNFSLEIKLQ
jgi:hypothetical protein